MSMSPPSSPVQSVLARAAQKRRYQTFEELSSPMSPSTQSTSCQRKYPRLEMFTPPTPAHATSLRALRNESLRLEMSSNSPTPVPSAETLFGDFRVLEQECQKLEKKAHKIEEMYRRAQFKAQNTEDSFNQLMHMHRWALAQLENAKDSIDSLKVDLNEARNGDWYFWDFVGELRCGICNQDLDGAYSLTCRDTFHGSCLWQWFEATVREHMVDTALGQVKSAFVRCFHLTFNNTFSPLIHNNRKSYSDQVRQQHLTKPTKNLNRGDGTSNVALSLATTRRSAVDERRHLQEKMMADRLMPSTIIILGNSACPLFACFTFLSFSPLLSTCIPDYDIKATQRWLYNCPKTTYRDLAGEQCSERSWIKTSVSMVLNVVGGRAYHEGNGRPQNFMTLSRIMRFRSEKVNSEEDLSVNPLASAGALSTSQPVKDSLVLAETS
ncbi:hypothetical protein ARMGADRAFT_1040262 [Armillaria gallica]|uniref:Uncharacterized protein n=1 Tax=Armillaria gallica TaxID=47427 RepID=A0A2H3CFS0_ARMGA|nr:hypothetical protein ARMGADRAFT_1040262 [Armillaria gallica]